jgi:hypothetical protein
MNPRTQTPYAPMGQWTPHQALTTVLFLERLAALIWRRHGTEIGRFLDDTDGVEALGPFAQRVPPQMPLFPDSMTRPRGFDDDDIPWEPVNTRLPDDNSMDHTHGGHS